jgi:hypothetical protein
MLMSFAGVERNGFVELMFAWVMPGVLRAAECLPVSQPTGHFLACCLQGNYNSSTM